MPPPVRDEVVYPENEEHNTDQESLGLKTSPVSPTPCPKCGCPMTPSEVEIDGWVNVDYCCLLRLPTALHNVPDTGIEAVGLGEDSNNLH